VSVGVGVRVGVRVRACVLQVTPAEKPKTHMKVICLKETERVLGIHIVGDSADEMLQVWHARMQHHPLARTRTTTTTTQLPLPCPPRVRVCAGVCGCVRVRARGARMRVSPSLRLSLPPSTPLPSPPLPSACTHTNQSYRA
jgi:hypothetical protein